MRTPGGSLTLFYPEHVWTSQFFTILNYFNFTTHWWRDLADSRDRSEQIMEKFLQPTIYAVGTMQSVWKSEYFRKTK